MVYGQGTGLLEKKLEATKTTIAENATRAGGGDGVPRALALFPRVEKKNRAKQFLQRTPRPSVKPFLPITKTWF